MKKGLLNVLSLLMCISCGVKDLDDSGRKENGVWVSPIVDREEEGQRMTTYVVGIDYPEGYDWRADSEKESVKCSLVVFWDGTPMIRIPVGREYEVSADPDMHRLVDGCLFTDFSTASETVIKKNGELLFRYPGREILVGILYVGDDVYSLGQSRDGEGFAFRKNGEELLSRTSGYAFEHLQLDSGKVCFAFCEPIRSAEGVSNRYFTVSDGTVERLEPLYNVKEIRDVIFHDGKLSYLGILKQKEEPVIVTDGSPQVLMKAMYQPMKAGTLYAAGEDVWAECLFPRQGESVRYGLWNGTELYEMFPPGTSVSSICVDGDELMCIVEDEEDGSSVYKGTSVIELPEGYCAMGRNTSAVINGMLTVGLSHRGGGRPVVWRDGLVDTLKINGYITALTSSE